MTQSQPRRKAGGTCIDRAQPLAFTFNGEKLTGYAGDTLASALLANGVRVVGRSFKFHRPRGVLAAGVEEPNAILGVDTGSGLVPVTRATITPLCEGLRAESQNCFPSLGFDVGRILDFTRRLWPAGFYNKVFKWPNWHLFEWVVRRMAGLGVIEGQPDKTRYRHVNMHCDVLVVGAGPAGLNAALEAGRSGYDVVLVEQDVKLGGSLLFDESDIDGQRPDEFLASASAELASMVNVRVMLRATVAGYYDHNVLTIHDRYAADRGGESVETFWKVRAGRVVLATGAIEQPLMFGNNDLPGIMLADAVLQYAKRYGVHCGEQIVVVANNDLAWKTAIALVDADVHIAAIVDERDDVGAELQTRARQKSISVRTSATILTAIGSKAVRSLKIRTVDGLIEKLACDVVAMSGGLNPTVHLYSQAGGKLRYDDGRHCFVPDTCSQHVEVVGSANGDFAAPEHYRNATRAYAPASSGSQWVDFLHDVTVSDIELAVRENYVSVEHLKRYTTMGMAVDQGKTSNLNALTVLGSLTGQAPGEVGTTTFRPQFMPVTMGAIAGNRRGDFYSPARHTPVHDWHVQQGAVFDDYGAWKRPAYYGEDREACIDAEVRKVRASAGLFDGSPLGKIEVKGPDAAEFLNRIYVNTVPTLKTGKVRYGLMLNENGIIIDDGVFVRLAEDHFLVNSTSGAADRIVAWLEEWRQCEYPHLEVIINSVTSQWAVAAVAGPRSREILAQLPGMADLSTDALPHMSYTSGSFGDGTPYRLQRVSFSGEQSYELSVPATRATEYFERISEIGQLFGMAPIGIEAILVLRTEKGFLHVGVDTDATTNPFDVRFGRIVANKKTDFVGARSLRRAEDQRPDRRQLVGFEVPDEKASVLAGAHILTGSGTSQRSEGFVTTAYRSPTLNKVIGLCLLERGFERQGEAIEIFDDGKTVSANIVDACFYDPDGGRMHA